MDAVTPWNALFCLITQRASAGKNGRPAFALKVMRRIHLLKQLFGHSDLAMKEGLYGDLVNANWVGTQSKRASSRTLALRRTVAWIQILA